LCVCEREGKMGRRGRFSYDEKLLIRSTQMILSNLMRKKGERDARGRWRKLQGSIQMICDTFLALFRPPFPLRDILLSKIGFEHGTLLGRK